MSNGLEILIVSLLPVTALITVLQRQPYYALISRGIMGVVAVMVYAVMGAADVALTEALVGTLLTVVLFAITVRSSLAIRIGILDADAKPSAESPVRLFCTTQKLYQRWVTFETEKELVAALKAGRVDAVCIKPVQTPLLKRYLPDEYPAEADVTLLAEHCRWHERKMKEQFAARERITRLIYRGQGRGH
jgi:putative multicomponent Na+:H+ antiporter subunit B